MDIRETRSVDRRRSIDLDINLLVLACGTSSIAENLLRGSIPGLPPWASNCAYWNIFLSEGTGPITSSVGLSLSCLVKVRFETFCRFLRAGSNVVFESKHDAGGHFAAYEKPEALADDLRRMFGKGGPATGTVPGHNRF